MVQFDAYTATTRALRHDDLYNLAWMSSSKSLDKHRVGRGFKGFQNRASVVRDDGAEAFAVSWGGRHNDLVMLEAKGECTPQIVKSLRAALPEHSCTRVDSCVDVDDSDAWDRMLAIVLDVKQAYRLKGERRGDWDYPEDGRTQYLGAPSSPVRLRLYEKGKQPEYRHCSRPSWVRMEAQVRPTKDAKQVYSKLDALQVWGASPFTRDLAAKLLHAHLPPVPAGTVWRQSSQERAIRFMCKQYGAHLISLMHDLGDWESVGLTLAEIIKEEKSRP